MKLRKVPKIDAVLGKFDNVHVLFACIVLAATDKLPAVDLWLKRKPIRRFALPARRPVNQDHAVVVDRFPVPVGGWTVLGVGSVANPAISVNLPAVKRALQPISLDAALGQVRTLVRAERLHGRDTALCPAAKQHDLFTQALDLPDFTRPDFTGRR